MTTAFRAPTATLTFAGGRRTGVVYDDLDDGGFVVSARTGQTWVEALIASDQATFTRDIINARPVLVSASEVQGEAREAMWRDHIKLLRPGRSGAHRPDPNIRLIALTPLSPGRSDDAIRSGSDVSAERQPPG